jgi:drug/metabolite transporter superfamily protein YnfA
MAGDRTKAAFAGNLLLEAFLAFAAQLLFTEANSLLTQISVSPLGRHYDARGGVYFVV